MRMKFEFKLGDILYYKGKFPFMLNSIKYNRGEVSYIFKKGFYEVSAFVNYSHDYIKAFPDRTLSYSYDYIKAFPDKILLGEELELNYEEIFETFSELVPTPGFNLYFEDFSTKGFSQNRCCRMREFFIEREKYILKK